jgi:hypothetical protein
MINRRSVTFALFVLGFLLCGNTIHAQSTDNRPAPLSKAVETMTQQRSSAQATPATDKEEEATSDTSDNTSAEQTGGSSVGDVPPVVAGKGSPGAAGNGAPSRRVKSSPPPPDESTEQQQESPPEGAAVASDLAKKLANPVASLISFPIQPNFDFGMGTGSGWRMTTNVQPVIPIALNKEWNLISRTILPIIHQGNVTGGDTSQSGLGDIVQSIFFSPNKTEPLIWGVGPVVLVPTATNGALGSKQLGLGVTVVALKQRSGWTVGALWNHIWRVAGGSGRSRVNSDFIQPFLAYSTKDGWTYTINTESVYDWTANHWNVPIHGVISKVVRFGKQPVSFGGGIRCWATSTPGGPQGCGMRMVVTLIFPKK